MNLRRVYPLFGLAVFMISTAANATVHRVFPGESIQAVIDIAAPGDTILVEPGTYQEDPTSLYGLRISTDNLRLIGKVNKGQGDAGKVRLLANGDQETGVYAAPAGCEYKDSECADELQGFHIRGFTVEEFPVNGIQTRWVDGFEVIRYESINNLNNGLYPTLSTNGLVQNNFSYGSQDTALWVAGSEMVRVIGNELTFAPTGLEITVSNEVLATNNTIHDNTIGVGLYHPNAAGNPQKPVMVNWVIENNYIYDNNVPGLAPPGTFQSLLPPGGGVLLLGVSDHVIGKNTIENNDFFGIAVLGWCTAVDGTPEACDLEPPQADPSSNNNRIYLNRLTDNGGNPPEFVVTALSPKNILSITQSREKAASKEWML